MGNHLTCTDNPKVQCEKSKKMLEITSKALIRDQYESYLSDESRLPPGAADRLIFPFSEDQISDILAQSFPKSECITVSGARTGLVGGGIPDGGVLISMEKMNQQLDLKTDEDHAAITVQPGLLLQTLNENLRQSIPSWFYPPDPTEKTASIGGNVATNASGGRSYKYGPTRNFVQAIRIILCDGTPLSLRRGENTIESGKIYTINGLKKDFTFQIPPLDTTTIKNTAGYFIRPQMDLIDLFIGSEGTLGVITEIELSLLKKKNMDFAAIAFFLSEEQAIEFVVQVKSYNREWVPTSLEYFDTRSLDLLRNRREQEGVNSEIPAIPAGSRAAVYFEHECEDAELESIFSIYDRLLQSAGTSMDETWGGFSENEIYTLNQFRHAVPETVNMIIGARQKKVEGLYKISTDFVVPDPCLEMMILKYKEILESSNLQYVLFGHIGENHLHANILPNNEDELQSAKVVYQQLSRAVLELGGSLSGEHGIGKIKKHLFTQMYSKEKVAEFLKIKDAFDPKHRLENGVIF